MPGATAWDGPPWEALGPRDGCDLPGGAEASRWTPRQKLGGGAVDQWVGHKQGFSVLDGPWNHLEDFTDSYRLGPAPGLMISLVSGVAFVAAFLKVPQMILTRGQGETSDAESRAARDKEVGRLAASVRHPPWRTLRCAKDETGPASGLEYKTPAKQEPGRNPLSWDLVQSQRETCPSASGLPKPPVPPSWRPASLCCSHLVPCPSARLQGDSRRQRLCHVFIIDPKHPQ